jgi:uncharacterized secreted protein with C-terminal beta-propeller domain
MLNSQDNKFFHSNQQIIFTTIVMENPSDLFMKTSIKNFDGTNVEPFPLESQQIYQHIDPQLLNDFSYNPYNLPKGIFVFMVKKKNFDN